MKDKIFIDTNLIVYAYDESEREKRKICINLIKSFFNEEEAYISNQILGETYNILTNKIERPLSKEDSQIIIESLIRSPSWIVLNYAIKEIQQAMDLSINYNLHFWDALIASTMLTHGIKTIYTENEKDFKKIPGLKIINPFKK